VDAPAVAISTATAVPVPEPVAVEKPAVKMAPAPEVEEEKEDDFLISRSAWTPQRRVVREDAQVDNEVVAPFADLTNSREKPLSSSRFGRKAAKPSPEGKKQKHRLNRYSQVFNSPASSFGLQRPNSRRSTSPTWLGILLYARKRTILLTATAHVVAGSRALRVSRPRRGDTLENTWKAITEGRAPPLARHLKKADTFDTRPGRRPSGGGASREMAPPAPATMQKAETYNDAGARKVRREPSLGQDDLNRRVEAFINKFNMEMRLQRQESLKHYSEMVSQY
jgi:hypothetical protein